VRVRVDGQESTLTFVAGTRIDEVNSHTHTHTHRERETDTSIVLSTASLHLVKSVSESMSHYMTCICVNVHRKSQLTRV